MEEQAKELEKKKTIFYRIENTIYFCILIPVLIVTVSVLFQILVYPEKIPHIFGYKIFMIFDDNLDESIKYGDLVFTKNIKPETLEIGDVIAFRNCMNTVTIHKIIDIGEGTFTMNALKNETADTRYISEEKVEGLLVYRIPKIGEIFYYLQHPLIMVAIGGIIIIIGLIWIYIAQELDKRDELRLQQENNKGPNEKEKND